jgi:quinol-cytochrome oxidoreductase complex cytochrome b subunit
MFVVLLLIGVIYLAVMSIKNPQQIADGFMKNRKYVGVGLLLFLVLFCVSNSFYSVSEDQMAVHPQSRRSIRGRQGYAWSCDRLHAWSYLSGL